MQNNNHEFIFNRYEEKERLQLGRQHNHAINTFFFYLPENGNTFF